MNDQMFASMAEQMHPDAEVLARLTSRLDELDAPEPGSAAPAVTAPTRRRVPPARAWIGIAAALLVCVLLVPTFT